MYVSSTGYKYSLLLLKTSQRRQLRVFFLGPNKIFFLKLLNFTEALVHTVEKN